MKTQNHFYEPPQCKVIELQETDIICASPDNPFANNTELDFDE